MAVLTLYVDMLLLKGALLTPIDTFTVAHNNEMNSKYGRGDVSIIAHNNLSMLNG